MVAAANVHDSKLLRATLEAMVVARPTPTTRKKQHLCLDKAYDTPAAHATVDEFDYVAHIRPIGERPLPKAKRKHPPRRWVVERTLAWLSKCRAILVRYDKKPAHYRGLLQFACALLWYRRLARLEGLNEF